VAIYEEDKSIGSSKTVLPCVFEGEPLHIVFNCFYIEDILKHSKGDIVIFNLIKSGPMLVEQEEDKNYRYVVTPMRGR
jgi:DNA polymerase III subunit beta